MPPVSSALLRGTAGLSRRYVDSTAGRLLRFLLTRCRNQADAEDDHEAEEELAAEAGNHGLFVSAVTQPNIAGPTNAVALPESA